MKTFISRASISRTGWAALSLSSALAFAGCGLKGPLYLPDKAANVQSRAPTAKRSDDSDPDRQKAPGTPDPATAPAAGNASATPVGQVSAPTPPR